MKIKVIHRDALLLIQEKPKQKCLIDFKTTLIPIELSH